MNKKRFENFQEPYPYYCKNDASSYKGQKSGLWEKKIQLPKNQFYLYFQQTPGLIWNNLKRPNILQQTVKNVSRIRYARIYYRNYQLIPGVSSESVLA